MIEGKDILNWCFTIVSINFGVFGFLYSIYVGATTTPTPSNPIRPFVAQRVIPFCRILTAITIILTTLAGVTCVQIKAGIVVWLILLCLAVLGIFALWLAWTMS